MMNASIEALSLSLLTGAGVFALVGLIWNLAEGWFETRERSQ
jgi:hypothetical protein